MKKRVIIYGINYAPEIAGVGRYTGEIGEYLAAQRHDVTVITAPPHYPGWVAQGDYSGWAWGKETLAEARVYRCPLYLNREMRGIRRLLAPLTFALSSAPVAAFQILKRRPDVVIAVEPTLFSAPVALAAARLVGAKTVLHVQDLEIDAAFAVGHLTSGGLAARVARAFDRAVLRRFDRVITISSRMAEKIFDKGVAADRIEIVRNWVDVEQIRPQPISLSYRAELGLAPDDFVVLYSGNIGAKQGVRLLIEAARQLQGTRRIMFAIAGQGPMRPDVERAAQTLPNIRLFDFAPEDRFAEFLSIANVHVLPQEKDAADLLLPSKLGGMLASGRPIIVTADPGTELAYFLGDSCAFTPPGDASALARAVTSAASQPPSERQRAERLQRAAALSKTILLPQFAEQALFLQSVSPMPEQAMAAA
ncbi:MAG: WcaI family glycosyltransferase [Methylobacteriaceae bacterium]|nr:WcaI family glycosyltransferase [Methylobacteriaceae bacterium]